MNKIIQNNPLESALNRLRANDVVAIPTETVYGLAANIYSPEAVEKIFSIKERPFFDPLIVHLSSPEDAKQVVKIFPPLAEKLSKKFWPGPLTMVLPKLESINPMITSGLETVGIRVPKHALTLELIRQFGSPLAAPSANKFMHTSPTSAAHVRAEFESRVEVLDGGTCDVGLESTVIGFNNDFTEIFVFRAGAITVEMLTAFAPTKYAQSPAAPGQLKHHYQPRLPLIVLATTPHLSISIYEQILAQLHIEALRPSWMSISLDSPQIAARQLYSSMRAAAEIPHKNAILLPYHPLGSDTAAPLGSRRGTLWDAIDDRVLKAATLVF